MRILTVIALLISVSAVASVTEGGRGMLFGGDHVFAVTAKSGWVLDNQSGVSQGLHMVFYLKGFEWSNSPVIIYGRAVSTSEVPTIKLQIEHTISDFHSSGSPNYSSKEQAPLILANGRKAEIYYFFGDKWGNYEAVAYFKEADTINYLVFNSKTENNFFKYISDFRQIVYSYKNLYTPPSTLSKGKLDELKRESTSILNKTGGKEYESKAVQSIGKKMASVMRDCTSYLPNKKLQAFSYFVRINGDGEINNSYIFPTNALSGCFKGLMSNARYPKHMFGSFVLNIKMKVAP